MIPVLGYPDVREAVDWLTAAFGFAQDPGGHSWTFSETLADVAPETWGGTSLPAH